MREKKYLFISIALLVSLFIYIFYRTDKTVITGICISIVSFDNFIEMRNNIRAFLPLREHMIYSLPEGLWVFSITLTSKHLFLDIGRKIDLVFIPLVFSIGLELFQLFNFVKGQFDFWDIGISIVFWTIANYLIKTEDTKQNILKPFTTKSFICVLSYLIVFFAHVWR